MSDLLARAIRAQNSFNAHIKEVEDFLNYNDPPTLLLRALEQRVTQSGLDDLERAEQVFYAINTLTLHTFNDALLEFIRTAPAELVAFVPTALTEISFAELIEPFERARSKAAGVDAQHSDTVDHAQDVGDAVETPFDLVHIELHAAVDHYAAVHGLLSRYAKEP